jgi:hypothetical protein
MQVLGVQSIQDFLGQTKPALDKQQRLQLAVLDELTWQPHKQITVQRKIYSLLYYNV